MNKHRVFMDVAATLSALGTCDRKAVGAIIVRDGRAISWGYNGAPPGLLHCDVTLHGWFEPVGGWDISLTEDLDDWWERNQMIGEPYCRNATHAEANALAFAAKQGISTDEATLYVTVSPCEVCSRLIIAAGVNAVYFREEYRDTEGIKLLRQALIPCHCIP